MALRKLDDPVIILTVPGHIAIDLSLKNQIQRWLTAVGFPYDPGVDLVM
ncbi:MAG: hypothetical protein K2N48_14030 [Muribaculaceae bacterium]|nr:hypothetical protein [Muribaculaceae bacterium]